MAASVPNTPRAVEASVFVVRAFVKLREMLASHETLSRKLGELERRIQGHDDQILALRPSSKRFGACLSPPPATGHPTAM